MANETYVTVRGRLTADVELRFTPSGAGVANFTVASNARKFNKQTNEWENKEAKFWRCNAWNNGKLALAENAAELLKKGDAVIAYGEVETRSYTTKEGEKRTVDELRIESIGKDLMFHKPGQQGNGFQPPAQQVTPQPNGGGSWAGTPAQDPWGTGGNGGGWGGNSDNPPY